MLEQHRRPNQSFAFSPEISRLGRTGYNLDATFKKKNSAGSIINVVAATIGQGFPPVQSPLLAKHTSQQSEIWDREGETSTVGWSNHL
jgi:hypothetical protein